jgi:transcription initiation factor TFIID subunit 2
MDDRYYYGLRVQAARSLVHFAVPDLEFVGQYHLIKAFTELFCFEDSRIPRANDFSDFSKYLIQKAIPTAMSQIRDESTGECPMEIKNFLFDQLHYNENSGNPFTDSNYICTLIQAIAHSVMKEKGHGRSVSSETLEFVSVALAEIDRFQRLDKWIPSVRNIVTITAICQKEQLAHEGYMPVDFEELVEYTHPSNNPDVRLAAFRAILNLGGFHNAALVRYTFQTASHDPSPYVRYSVYAQLPKVMGVIALNGDVKQQESIKNAEDSPIMIIEENGNDSALNDRRQAALRATVPGALHFLKESLRDNYQLRKELWTAIAMTPNGIMEKRVLLEVSRMLYDPKDSLVVTIPIPKPRKRLVAERVGRSLIVIKRSSPVKIQIPTGLAGSLTPTTGYKRPRTSLVLKAPESKRHAAADPASPAPKVKLKLRM